MQGPVGRLINLFLRRKIENQKTIDACLSRLAMKALEPKLENRIEVSVKDNWHLRFRADLPDALENAGNGGTRCERALRGQLVHDAVRERIGKGKTELQQIDARFFESEGEIDRG